MVHHTDGLKCLPGTLEIIRHVTVPRGGSPTLSGMAHMSPLLLLLSFVTHAAGLPIICPHGTTNTLTKRGEAKSSLSNEAIISLAAIFVSIFLFVLSLTLPASRKLMGCWGRRETAKPRRKLHRRWHRSRR